MHCLIYLSSRSSRPEVFFRKDILKICNKFTVEHPCQSVISIKLQSNFIEITLRHGCSPVNLLHIFRTPFTENTSGQLLLNIVSKNLSRFFLNACRLYLWCSPFLSCYGICFFQEAMFHWIFPSYPCILTVKHIFVTWGKTH